MDNKKKVILINGDSSKWYEQAIFIINPDISANNIPIDFVSEAERIINNYMMNQKKYNTKTSSIPQMPSKKNIVQKKEIVYKNNKTLDVILNTCVFLCIVLIGIILYSFTKI